MNSSIFSRTVRRTALFAIQQKMVAHMSRRHKVRLLMEKCPTTAHYDTVKNTVVVNPTKLRKVRVRRGMTLFEVLVHEYIHAIQFLVYKGKPIADLYLYTQWENNVRVGLQKYRRNKYPYIPLEREAFCMGRLIAIYYDGQLRKIDLDPHERIAFEKVLYLLGLE